MKYQLGFLGGGQLARMSIQAAQRMGLRCVSLDASDRTPAAKIADFRVGSLRSADDVRGLFDVAEMVTLENEFIPAETIFAGMEAGGHKPLRLVPGLEALATVQDKLLQRRALIEAGVPSPRAVSLERGAESAIQVIGFPMVLKARFGGYDGRGTRYARNLEELLALESEWGVGGWLAEEFVQFHRELAVMAVVRGSDPCCFPTVETIQTNSVCDMVMPCDADAAEIAIAAVKAVRGVGLFGVELFQRQDGKILVNELAPRPHNSGHYTLDWGGPSQFDYHVRSVLGLPMVEPKSNSFAVMANLLGQSDAGAYEPALRCALEEPNSFVHWYEKDEAKPGRKMGHINVVGADLKQLSHVVEAARRSRMAFYRGWTSR